MAYANRHDSESFFERSRPFGISCSICSRERLLRLAGVYELWQPEPATGSEPFTIIKTRANRLIDPIHDRMRVILYERAAERLDEFGERDPLRLKSLLAPAQSA
jgi:putative SOS response-associated peptidase YedK